LSATFMAPEKIRPVTPPVMAADAPDTATPGLREPAASIVAVPRRRLPLDVRW
jgi:hypothetical protein